MVKVVADLALDVTDGVTDQRGARPPIFFLVALQAPTPRGSICRPRRRSAGAPQRAVPESAADAAALKMARQRRNALHGWVARSLLHEGIRPHTEGQWPDGPYCPRCGVGFDRITGRQRRPRRAARCGPQARVHGDGRNRFRAQPRQAAYLVFAAHLLASSKKGISLTSYIGPSVLPTSIWFRPIACVEVDARTQD